MPWQSFSEMLEAARSRPQRTIAVAAAADADVLEAIKGAVEMGIARAILVGPEASVRQAAASVGLDVTKVEIVDAADAREAAQIAARLATEGRAQVLMKGMVSSADFLGALLSPEAGLRRASLLSHLACFEVPALGRLLFVTDGGMVLYPDLAQKVQILHNAIGCLHALGWEQPKVAVLAAVEIVNPKMPPTLDAAELVKLAESGQFPAAIVAGPLALDGAVSPEACRHKGITGPVAGQADLLLVPTIESGNILGKAFIYGGGAKMAGLVLGAAVPAVLTSRAETAAGKLASIGMAMLATPS